MSDQMTVLWVRGAGHVLGAVTHTASVPEPPSAAGLAGTGLPIRLGGAIATVPTSELATATVPTSELATATVALDPTAFADPLAMQVTVPPQGGDPKLEPVGSVTATIQTPGIKEVTVQLDDTRAKPTPVVVIARGRAGEPSLVLKGEVPAGESDGVLPHTLRPGSKYDLLVLARGCRAVMATEKVPS
jgi:hypothetical protein